MRVFTYSALPLSAALFTLMLVPSTALAGTKDCPSEPATNVSLGDGQVIIGPNCNLYNVGDVDSFVFTGTSGDTYQLAVAINGSAPIDICLTLYSPSLAKTPLGCTNIAGGDISIVPAPQKLTATGSYTVDVTETSTATLNYALSLERLYPFPPNAEAITLAKVVDGDIAELTDSNAFTFAAQTTGVYEASAMLTGSPSHDLCMIVYQPDGSIPANGSGCTNIAGGDTVIHITFTPSEDGTSMAFLFAAGYDGTATYTIEVSCVAGECPVPSTCSLKDALSYASGTLTMDFTVENTYATTWNIWVVYQNNMQLLYSAPQPITDSPTAISKTAPLTAEGKVGVLSTLTTPKKGIACSSWVQIGTGMP